LNADRRLNDSPDEQGAFVTRTPDHVVDREAREECAEAVARRRETGRQAAPVRKPAHHQADDTDIDDAGSEAADDSVGDVERH
jgi:hypothetical protein